MMTPFDSDEMPPPMPSSCRPFGSGLPSTPSRMGSIAARSAGRSFAWKKTPLEEPPRMKTAGMKTCVIACLRHDASCRLRLQHAPDLLGCHGHVDMADPQRVADRRDDRRRRAARPALAGALHA